MERRRQREIALTALAVLAVTVPAPASASGRPAAAPQSAVRPTPSSQAGGPAEVDLSALNASKTEPQEMVRNPFRFKPKPAPPPPPPAPVQPAIPQPTGPVEPPPPPRIPLKFIGFLEIPKKGLLASLTDGRAVYHGFEGQTIEGRYRIIRIGVESIDLAYIDGRGRQTIRLTGQ
jgi:hypothetical protein